MKQNDKEYKLSEHGLKNIIKSNKDQKTHRLNKYLKNPKHCKECNTELPYEKRKNTFCDRSCRTRYNNKLRKSKIKYNNCIFCGEKTSNKKYCGHNCQGQQRTRLIFEKIEDGDISQDERSYKKYLIHKFGESCMECGWDKRNPVTGNVPIELEHINGHYKDNRLSNLKLLCPNCHSLTPTYKALNIGNGRNFRKT